MNCWGSEGVGDKLQDCSNERGSLPGMAYGDSDEKFAIKQK